VSTVGTDGTAAAFNGKDRMRGKVYKTMCHMLNMASIEDIQKEVKESTSKETPV
jgi:hypothetical protein